ncbi:MAG: hypothetical protein ACE5R4_05245 [Armatimonadota bacterium]
MKAPYGFSTAHHHRGLKSATTHRMARPVPATAMGRRPFGWRTKRSAAQDRRAAALRVKPTLVALAVVLVAMVSCAGADVEEVVLQNGEPVVGVYYYPWFLGAPYNRVGWTPERPYDNINNERDIYLLLKSISDYGINHLAFSYWNNAGSLDLYGRTMRQAERLMEEGRPLYICPYLEPPTIDERYDTPEGRRANADFITTYLGQWGKSPCYPELGGRKLTDMYVSYYTPSVPGQAEAGTPEHVRLQRARAEALNQGWRGTMADVKAATGFDTIYTADNSRTNIGLTEYMRAMTGLTWYSFGWEMNNPFCRPKVASEVAKYTEGIFQYTISPGYVDRQQRWPGARIERDPFLYEYAWSQAMSTLPEGVMILTHSEWFEGSIIDVTKEYGKKHLELTELFGSVFKETFAAGQTEKQRKKPVAVIYNEHVPFRLNAGGRGVEDVYGCIKALEVHAVLFDVIPEYYVTAAELAGRECVLAPTCGVGFGLNAQGEPVNEVIARWAREEGHRLAITGTEAPEAEGLREAADHVLPESWGADYLAEYKAVAAGSKRQLSTPLELLAVLKAGRGVLERTTSWWEIKASPPLRAGDGTYVVEAVNVLPWAYIVEGREVGGGLGQGHSAETTRPWQREDVTFTVPGLEGVRQVDVILSDSARSERVPFQQTDDGLRFTHPLKFFAHFAVQQSPLVVSFPDEMRIRPGQSIEIPVVLDNQTGEVVSGQLSVRRVPGLTATPTEFSVPADRAVTVRLPVKAGLDYATGQRTVVFVTDIGGRGNLYWRQLECVRNARLALRTRVLAGDGGKTSEVKIAVQNAGQSRAEKVVVRLGGQEARIPRLEVGEVSQVTLPFAFTDGPRAERLRQVQVSLGRQDRGDGMRHLPNIGDGGSLVVERGGREGRMPDLGDTLGRGAPSRYLYFALDDVRFPPGEHSVAVLVKYFDEGRGQFIIEYDSTAGDDIESQYKDTRACRLANTREWKEHTFHLPDAKFANRQNEGADFRITGQVIVSDVSVRTETPNPDELGEATVVTTHEVFGETIRREHGVKVLRAYRPAPGVEFRGRPPPVWLFVANQHGGELAAPVLIPRSVLPADWAPQSVGLWDGGRRAGLPVRATEEGLLTVLPLEEHRAQRIAVWHMPEGAPQPPVQPRPPALRLSEHLDGDDGFVTVYAGAANLTFDEAKGGNLAGLHLPGAEEDYAYYPGGSCVVEYQVDGERVALDRVRGKVEVEERDEVGCVVTCERENDDLRVADRWTIWMGADYALLDRTVTFKRELAVEDFVICNARFNPKPFQVLYPLGVGKAPEGQAESKGWLETWHIADGWLAVNGTGKDAWEAAGLSWLGGDELYRVRYGFLDDHCGIRLRTKKSFKRGEQFSARLALLFGRDQTWRMPSVVKALVAEPPLVYRAGSGQVVRGVQVPEVEVPSYMDE